MNTSSSSDARLENDQGQSMALQGNCSLGRSSDNQVVIASERASRRHAIIHAQEGGEYWLADLGSANGTFLNERRLTQPTRLRNGDVIQIAHSRHVFCQTLAETSQDDESQLNQLTVVDVRTEECWLLIGDVESFTTLSQRLTPDELAAQMGRWVRTCKEQIEGNGGVINKYLGDGFMAYWRGGGALAEKVARAAQGLRQSQRVSELKFRLVLHCGKVAMGGSAALNEESLMGPEVNFAFRAEKVAADLKVEFCVSENAQKLLGSLLPLTSVLGEHQLKGFSQAYRFYSVA